MTAPCPWSVRLQASKGPVGYGARRTTAHVLKEGLKRAFGRVVGEVRRCGDVRRNHPIDGRPILGFLKPAHTAFPFYQRRAAKAEDPLGGNMRRNRYAPTAADNGSFLAGAGARWRRRPNSRQQSSLKIRLTRLTDSTHRLTGAGYAEAMA